MASVVLNGVTYTDDANGSTGMANGGHRVRFVPCLANFVIEAATQLALQHDSRDAADASEAAALASEIAAAASAASALNAPGTNSTSATTLSFGLGSKSLTIQTGKAYALGQFLNLANIADPTQWMNGVITAFDSGTGSLTVSVGTFKGAGSCSNWSVALSGPDALPRQTGFGGKYLSTDGVVASWVTPSEFASLRRHAFMAAGAATSAGTAAQDAALSAKKARRYEFLSKGNYLQVQQMTSTLNSSKSRSYFYGNF